jgi:hypothetical protein
MMKFPLVAVTFLFFSAAPTQSAEITVYQRSAGEIGGACGSACPIIWFGGRRSLIQRNSLLVFHMPYDAQTGKASPAAIAAVIDYLRFVGLSDRQARFLATAALPEDGWVATEASALALGFHPQVVITPLATRTCQSRFCLGIP